MAGVGEKQGQTVFGLDIGTRSIVGTVGYSSGGMFHVIAQRCLEHETRAMIDGQIHDIAKVAEGIGKVKALLEQDLGSELKEVCIAAAGRVLRTVTTNVEMKFDGERDVVSDDLYELAMMGVQKAYEEFHVGDRSNIRFYCVGYTVMRYYLNGYHITNPETHKARSIGADLIATFLPDDVVDGLYKSVEIAGLHVANLTLEPIAAIQVAIPEKYRLLNMALVDVGAGTSDICITREGTITAYGMIPVAGDSLTDCIAQHCLVDFGKAEQIKREINDHSSITYEDIMGLEQTITSADMLEILKPSVDEMTRLVADTIRELNGGKSVSAVFVIGGGGMIPGYTESLASKLGLPLERVAIRGEEVLKNVSFEVEDARKDSMMVTPIGICYSFYEQSNNFIFVEFNGVRTKLYDNGKLTVADAAIQSQFPNEDLFPKRGEALNYTVNDKPTTTRGSMGEPSIISVNGEPADLYTRIKNGDWVDVSPSTRGENASMEVGRLADMKGTIRVFVNGREVKLPKIAEVNGVVQPPDYRIKDKDVISVRQWYTVQEIAAFLGLPLGGGILVNDMAAGPDSQVHNSYAVSWIEGTGRTATVADGGIPRFITRAREAAGKKLEEDARKLREEEEERIRREEEERIRREAEARIRKEAEESIRRETQERIRKEEEERIRKEEEERIRREAEDRIRRETQERIRRETQEHIGSESETVKAPPLLTTISVVANGRNYTLRGKSSYVYVDIFDYIQFDLRNSAGRSIVTLLNGRRAEYMEALHNGDVIDIHWE